MTASAGTWRPGWRGGDLDGRLGARSLAENEAYVLDVTGPLEIFGRAARLLRDRGVTAGLPYTVEVGAEVPDTADVV